MSKPVPDHLRQRAPGAGRKPAGYEPPQERIDLDREKARHEAAKASRAELELAIRLGEFVPRVAVAQAAATALAALAQTLRSVPDNLERKLGIAPDVATEIGMQIDSALATCADAFEDMHAVSAQAEAAAEGAHDDLL